MMTIEKMRGIIETEVKFDELKKNAGITIFYSEGNIDLGVSYEDGECGEKDVDRYIYNLFVDDEYINIPGCGTKECYINEDVLHELIEAWNSFLD